MPAKTSQSVDAEDKILPDLLPYLLQRASFLVTREFHRKLQLGKVPPNRWRMMVWLSENQPYSISDLTDRLMLKQPSVTQLVDNAIRDGLVRKDSDPDDARRTVITLTEEGEELVARIRERALIGREHVETMLGADLSRQLTARLKETIERLE
ncbi:MarR family winged helix-turn-helix transcriptional regulator [Stappia indica]|uniref:MarR family winged helix-turn-helix transcriptional regulator n=1 Tax=Stappia indica TaxID=538381 RepID=UPI001CD54CA1|nr:MarR family transcriptional regulator [Stappia indica]MCA1300619.1 MarR family transcriptional regulator [Stappia indica]